MAKVQDIMTTNFPVCSPDSTIEEAARILTQKKLSGMPVVKDGKLVGVITQTDLLKVEKPIHIPAVLGFLGAAVVLDNPLDGIEVEKELKEVLATKVDGLMSREVTTISSDTEIKDAVDIMIRNNFSLLPVIEGDKLAGVLTRADIVRLLARK